MTTPPSLSTATTTPSVHNGHRPTAAAARDAVRVVLAHLGYDATGHGLVDTPDRVVRALTEMTAGQWVDPAPLLARVFPHRDDGMIAVAGIEFAAVCEHHLMPFSGTATVAYLPQPGAPVVGLSKLARLADVFARRLTMQERLTHQVTTALDTHLQTSGSACVVRSRHACMGARGARQRDAVMVTTSLTGRFRKDDRARAELFELAATAT